MNSPTRRDVLKMAAGIIAAAGVAGCANSTATGTTDQSSSGSSTTASSDSAATTAVAASLGESPSTFDIIHAKRLGQELSADNIAQLVNGFCAGDVSEAQMSSFMMAVCCKGMSDDEASELTETMVGSGERLDFTSIFSADKIVDKHSTGGVGDKTSFVIAPALAALGLIDPMMSGRGLGITGGTLDKLESIPGFGISLTAEQIKAQLQSVGFVMCGQTDGIAPADKKMYALRDVTATVDSIPLIASSIMSKKIAEGTKNLVIDLKCGKAAFMTNEDDARRLASLMEAIGSASGVNAKCLLTRMDAPLGRCVGNAVEIEESLAIMERGEQATTPALWEDITELGAIAVQLTIGGDHDDAIDQFTQAIASGSALQKFRDMCAAQGGDLNRFETARLDGVTEHDVLATSTGYVADVDAEAIGVVVRDLGGGRVQSTDSVNHQVGITDLVCIGEQVTQGQPLAKVRLTEGQDVADISSKIASAISVTSDAVTSSSILI